MIKNVLPTIRRLLIYGVLSNRLPVTQFPHLAVKKRSAFLTIKMAVHDASVWMDMQENLAVSNNINSGQGF